MCPLRNDRHVPPPYHRGQRGGGGMGGGGGRGGSRFVVVSRRHHHGVKFAHLDLVLLAVRRRSGTAARDGAPPVRAVCPPDLPPVLVLPPPDPGRTGGRARRDRVDGCIEHRVVVQAIPEAAMYRGMLLHHSTQHPPRQPNCSAPLQRVNPVNRRSAWVWGDCLGNGKRAREIRKWEGGREICVTEPEPETEVERQQDGDRDGDMASIGRFVYGLS